MARAKPKPWETNEAAKELFVTFERDPLLMATVQYTPNAFYTRLDADADGVGKVSRYVLAPPPPRRRKRKKVKR